MTKRPLLLTAIALRVCCAQIAPLPVEAPKPAVSADERSTPRRAVLGFLDAARAEDWRRAASFLSSSNGQSLAQQLKRVLDRKLLTDPGTLSDDPLGDLTDGLPENRELVGEISVEGKPFDLLLDRVTISSGTRVWQFAAPTLAAIPRINASIGNPSIEQRLPRALVENTFLDTALWQWLALLLLAIIVSAAARLVARAVFALIKPVVARTSSDVDDHLIQAITRPVRFLLAVLAFRVGLEFVVPPLLVRAYLMRLLAALAYFGLAWAAVRVIDAVAVQFTAVMTRRHRASAVSVVPLLRRTVKVIVILLAFILTLDFWGYNTTALVAGLGVGGLAVALAAQKTLENLFGGVSIISDKPVLVGDFCKWGDRSGTVEDIGLRSTRLRTVDRTVVTVPNGQFASLQIENFGRRDKILFNPTLNLRRDTTTDQLRFLMAEARKLLETHSKVDATARRVRFVAVGTHSLDIEVFTYILTTDFDEFLLIKEELLMGFLGIVEKAGTALAVPTQVNFLARDPRPDEGKRQTVTDMVAAWRQDS